VAENSKIEWTDHTWNPWIGCTKVGPPCDNCYAEDMMDKRYGRVRWGSGEDRVRTSASNWNEPLRWDRAAAASGRKAKVFCLSLGDIWDNEVDPLWRRQAFEVMERTPNLIYLLLSKRIGNAERMCDPCAGNPLLPRNAALGATMGNQEEYDRDRMKLKHVGEVLGALFTFASIEPMLGPIILDSNAPDWIIVGGESGRNARMMDPRWARDLRDGSARFGRKFFMKQMTRKEPIPPDLMVRQFPPALGLAT
jgi:protein gp37